MRAEFPADAEALASSAGPRSLGSGVGWTVVVALAWVLLAVWRPTTTWHLAPVLLAGALPWVVGQDLRAGDRSGPARVGWAGAGGFVVAALVTLGLARADLLRGPTLLGFGSATTEALVLGGATAALLVLLGVLRALRRPVARSAWVGSERLASSDKVVMVEGNAYFPAASIRPGALTPSGTKSVCPWKGVARYYTVTVEGIELPRGLDLPAPAPARSAGEGSHRLLGRCRGPR